MGILGTKHAWVEDRCGLCGIERSLAWFADRDIQPVRARVWLYPDGRRVVRALATPSPRSEAPHGYLPPLPPGAGRIQEVVEPLCERGAA